MRKFLTLTAAAAFALAVGFTGTAQAVDLSDGLVGYWPFDDGADPTDDASVNANTGTLGTAAGTDGADPAFETGAADIAPVFGNVSSLDFTPVNLVRVADTTDLEPTDVTASVWVRADGSPGNNRYVVSKGATGCSVASYALYTAGLGLKFYISDGVGTFVASPAVAAVTIWDNSWHHVAGTFDGSTVRFYIDGVEVGGGTATGLAIGYATTTTGDLLMGEFGGTCSLPFNGNIDEARIYDRALPLNEIQILASGKALPDPYADEVASFTLPPSPPNDDCLAAGGDCDTTADDNDQGADAVDAPDDTHALHGGGSTGVSTFTSLGFDNVTEVGGILKLNFTDNTCLDLGGDDIQIFEVSHGETYDVDIGLAGGSLANIGTDKSGDASLESSVAVFNQVALEATSGGAAGLDGPDIDAAECLNVLDFGPDHIQKENTGAETINIGVDVVQSSFQFQITIANNTGSDTGLDDILVFDVVPGEFDLVGDVAPTDNNGCTVTLTHPAGAVKKGLIKLEPEFITIDPSGLANGEMCMITVNVETDTKNFPRGKSPVFAPTECNEDTFIFLNEGVQVFRDDGDTGGVVDKNDTLLFEDDDPPIELTCVFPS